MYSPCYPSTRFFNISRINKHFRGLLLGYFKTPDACFHIKYDVHRGHCNSNFRIRAGEHMMNMVIETHPEMNTSTFQPSSWMKRHPRRVKAYVCIFYYYWFNSATLKTHCCNFAVFFIHINIIIVNTHSKNFINFI